MKVSESCACGASFGIELKDPSAIRLVREWRRKHFCPSQEESVEIAPALSADLQIADDPSIPEMHIGFRWLPEEEE